MRTFVGAVVGALVVAAGAGAYNAAVTPAQFSTLKHQVQVLKGKVSTLQNRVSSLQSSAAQNATTVTCLQQNWNAITIWSWDTYALNSAKYDSSQVGALSQESIVMAPTATASKC